MKQRTEANLWQSLEKHSQSFQFYTSNTSNNSLTFKKQQFIISDCNICLDYSNQYITSGTLDLLFSLANECHLREKIYALMDGGMVNLTENKPALHTALRASGHASIYVNNRNVMPEIMMARHKMRAMVEKIRSKNWCGFSGKPITNIVNIGIGGSDLGPQFSIQALSDFTTKNLSYYFISDADPESFKNTVNKLNPETTLFIISSKSFTTQETIYNAKKAIHWIGHHKNWHQHFIAVTANAPKALQFGITNILPIWDWIGGRFSFCSAINLITAIGIGMEQFDQLLAGANSMDQHFRNNDFATNLPVLLGLLGIWNSNFLHINNLLVLTYSQRLEKFVPYIQQLDMESNGKSIDNRGRAINYSTGPIVWGGSGNQAQHSYYQLLCQGTHRIAADFISLNEFSEHLINKMCDAKINVLSSGINPQDIPNSYIPGNTPINHISISEWTPFTIGAFSALYEHKIYTQSVIWDINPFDQPGVEIAKKSHRTQDKAIIATSSF